MKKIVLFTFLLCCFTPLMSAQIQWDDCFKSLYVVMFKSFWSRCRDIIFVENQKGMHVLVSEMSSSDSKSAEEKICAVKKKKKNNGKACLKGKSRDLFFKTPKFLNE